MGLKQQQPINVYASNAPFDLTWREASLFPQPTNNYSPGLGANAGSWTQSTTATHVAATSTSLEAIRQATSTSNNAISTVNAPANDSWYSTGITIQATFSIALDATASRRVFCGFTSASMATIAGSDTPTANYFGFRYSTGASDSLWRCMSDNNSGTPTNLSSGVTVTAAIFLLSVAVNPTLGQILYYINGSQVNATTAKVPATSVITLSPFISITNLSAGTARSFDCHFINIRARDV